MIWYDMLWYSTLLKHTSFSWAHPKQKKLNKKLDLEPKRSKINLFSYKTRSGSEKKRSASQSKPGSLSLKWRRGNRLIACSLAKTLISSHQLSFTTIFCCNLEKFEVLSIFYYYSLTHNTTISSDGRTCSHELPKGILGMWKNLSKHVCNDDSTGSFFKLPTWQDKTRNNWKQSDLTFNHFFCDRIRHYLREKNGKSKREFLKEVGLDFFFPFINGYSSSLEFPFSLE